MQKLIGLSCLLFFYTTTVHSQQVRPENSANIYRDIKMLKNLQKVLYFAAHPDDENTGLLTWLVNGADIETAYLSLTRGDGGQNILGNEQSAALGLMRTHELLDARALDGAQQFFTRAIDFGFSKNSQDTFDQWSVDSLTKDAVWVIRKYRPDVIICRFPPTAAAGHGQHAASAIVAAKAFDLAGDKNAFPEQLKYVKVWQPKRLLWNTFNFGGVNTTDNNQFKLLVGQYNPALGMGYGELAGLSRSMHKSQGAGTPSVAGLKTEYFSLVKGAPVRRSLFDDIDTSWVSIDLANIDVELNKIIDSFDFSHPDRSLPALLTIREALLLQSNKTIVQDKLQLLDKIILSCAGFMGEAVTDEQQAVGGSSHNFRLNVIARSPMLPVTLENIQWLNDKESVHKTLKNDVLEGFNHTISIPDNAPVTEPYWLAVPPQTPVEFSVPNDTLIGLPETPPTLNVVVSLKIKGQDFVVRLPLSYKKLDPVKGDVVEQLRIVPAMDISFQDPIYFSNLQDDDLHINIRFKNNSDKDLSDGTLTFRQNHKIVASFPNIRLRSADDLQSFSLTESLLSNAEASNIPLTVTYSEDGKDYAKEQHIISYPHIPTLQYFTPASALVLTAEIKVAAKKIGYIPGAGDFIPQFLHEAGLDIEILKPEDIADSNMLSRFDAIVTGVRVVNIEKRFPVMLPRLLDYVQRGGTLIMQYNTLQDMTTNNFGPYPFVIGNKRVTEENSEVKFLHPNERLLNYPNKISEDDFKNWVQERGAYFATNWDNHYTPLFEMHDKGEAPLQGSTIYTQYGKGYYIYTPLAFFRQLPAGNIGAIRLFFNFLSAGK